MIDKDRIKAEAEAFFEWPTSDKSKVTTASMLIFAGVIAEMAREEALEQAQQRIAELETKYECDCKEVNAARIYLRDQERLLREKAALALQVETMREALEQCKEHAGKPEDVYHITKQALSTQPAAEILALHDAKVIERCAAVVEEEHLGDDVARDDDMAYNVAIRHAADAIRALIAAQSYTPQAAKVSEKG